MPTPGQPALKASLLAILNNTENTTDEAADQMATAINNHLLGTTVSVTGTATAVQSGLGTAPVTGTGSV